MLYNFSVGLKTKANDELTGKIVKIEILILSKDGVEF